MRIALSLLSIILLVGLNSCSLSKSVRAAKSGSVSPTRFFREFTFEYIDDLIVIEVKIKGENYHFILDTGAFLSVVDEKVKNNFETEILANSMIRSSSGQLEKKQVIRIPALGIGGVLFENTSALVHDLVNLQTSFGCYEIDGIIGNNLMRKASWQIDYRNQTIRITDNVDNFKPLDSRAYSIALGRRDWGNSPLPLTFHRETFFFTFDTGFSGFVQLDSRMYNELITSDLGVMFATLKGSGGYDLYGRYTSNTKAVFIPKLAVGKFNLENQIIEFTEQGSSLVGNKFYENFLLTIDWTNHLLWMEPVVDFQPARLHVFELMITPDYTNIQLEVSGTWKEHALEYPIENNTKILKINNLDVSSFTKGELYYFWVMIWPGIEKMESVVIETKYGKTTLVKKLLLGQKKVVKALKKEG